MIKQRIKRIIRSLDRFLPYHFFYEFMMTKSEREVFDKVIIRSNNYLEFGVGGSTIRAIQNSKCMIHSVESSPEWATKMKSYFAIKKNLGKRLFIHYVDIGATKAWGYPVSEEKMEQFSDYSTTIFTQIDPTIIDLVLIDGRFRVACTMNTILHCHSNKNFNIVFDDFWNREHYHVVLDYLDIIEKADNLALFKIKENVDLKMAEVVYNKYKTVVD